MFSSAHNVLGRRKASNKIKCGGSLGRCRLVWYRANAPGCFVANKTYKWSTELPKTSVSEAVGEAELSTSKGKSKKSRADQQQSGGFSHIVPPSGLVR